LFLEFERIIYNPIIYNYVPLFIIINNNNANERITITLKTINIIIIFLLYICSKILVYNQITTYINY